MAVAEGNSVRVYLAGRVVVDAGDRAINHEDFPAQQGRLAFAYLITERSHPVPRADLIDVLWPTNPPAAADAAISAIASKLRSLFTEAGLTDWSLTSSSGCYELRAPGVWVDVEAASDAIHEAEAAIRAGDPQRAYGPSAVAHHIARRPFFAGDASPWAQARRDKLRAILLRALECRATVYHWNGEFSLAIDAANELATLERFRERAYQLLMRAHAAAGNRAEGLMVYERCRALLSEELGVDPSPATKAVHGELLRRA